MATILDTIVAKKHEEVAGLRRQGLPARTAADAPRGFIRALCAKPGVAIIAEAKKASPSKGLIEPGATTRPVAAVNTTSDMTRGFSSWK